MAIASSSPFKKDHIRNNMAYYLDDENIAIVERNSSDNNATNKDEWQSIKSTTAIADGDRLNITYHSRYVSVTGLEQDINVDIKNKKILIIEDIVDTGTTLDFLYKKLNKMHPDEIKVFSLLYYI